MAVYLVTGANRGIGLGFCKALCAQKHTVIAVCRQGSTELRALPVQLIEGIDITQDSVVPILEKALKNQKIDVVINNAGAWSDDSIDNLNFPGMLEVFNINAVGALRVTAAVLPYLSKGSKMVLITSRMGSIADNTSGGRYGYRMSKAAMNAAGKSLAIDLEDHGIAVAILHPGFVKTRMNGGDGMVTVEESVEGLLTRIEHLTLENTSTFWHFQGEVLPW